MTELETMIGHFDIFKVLDLYKSRLPQFLSVHENENLVYNI